MQLPNLLFPDDVLLRVVEAASSTIVDDFVYPDIPTLCALCLVSRQFSYAAQQVLYRSFDQGGQANWIEQRSLRSFMRTIISRPDLAALVRHVSITSIGQNTDSDLEHQPISTSNLTTRWSEWATAEDEKLDSMRDELWPDLNLDLQTLVQDVGHFSIAKSYARSFQSKLQMRRVQDAILLLYLLPNTQSLDFVVPSDATELREVLTGLRDAVRSQFLPRIDSIEFHFFGMGSGFQFRDVVPLLQRRNLKRIRAGKIHEIEEKNRHIDTHLMLAVEIYDLNNCILTHTALASLVNSTGRLKVLSLEYDSRAVELIRWLDLDVIQNALALHHRWLSYFRLVLPNDVLARERLFVTGRLHFREMEVLQYLELPEQALLGSDDDWTPSLGDTIPRSLRGFKLLDTTRRAIPHIHELLSVMDEEFPTLDFQIAGTEDES